MANERGLCLRRRDKNNSGQESHDTRVKHKRRLVFIVTSDRFKQPRCCVKFNFYSHSPVM